MKITQCKLRPDVCQALKTHITVLQYCFGVGICGTMYGMFLFLLSIFAKVYFYQLLDFPNFFFVIPLHFTIMPYFTLWMLVFLCHLEAWWTHRDHVSVGVGVRLVTLLVSNR